MASQGQLDLHLCSNKKNVQLRKSINYHDEPLLLYIPLVEVVAIEDV